MGRKVTTDEIRTASERIGPHRAQAILSTLARNADFMAAFSSDMGKAILSSCVDRLEHSVDRLISGSLASGSEEDLLVRAEIRVLRDILSDWTKIVKEHSKAESAWVNAAGQQ